MASADTPLAPPTACPFCRSSEIATSGKVAGDTLYWRCHACGQIWNPKRLIEWLR